MVNCLIFLGLLIFFVIIYASLIYKLGMDKGIHSASTIATTLAAIALAFFGWQQISETNRLREVQKTDDWGKLRNTMWEIQEQYNPGGVEGLRQLTLDEKISWLQNIRKLLDSEIGNPTLIQNKNSLGYWRNAISTAKITKGILQSNYENKDDRFMKSASSILSDVMQVWDKLILDSDEISATGGRPKEKEK